MSPSKPSMLEEATQELENEIRKARSFHQDHPRQPRTPPHRPPKLSLSTPPLPQTPPPKFPLPTRHLSPGRSFDNLPLPPRSTATSLKSSSSTSPPGPSASPRGMKAYDLNSRELDKATEGPERRERERTQSTPRSGGRLTVKQDEQSFEMQDRSPISAARFADQQSSQPTFDNTPSPSPKASPSKKGLLGLPKLSRSPSRPRNQSGNDAISTSPKSSPPRNASDSNKGKGKATAVASSDGSDSSSEEDEFSFLSPGKRPSAKKSSQHNNNAFLDFLQQGPPRSPPPALAKPSPPRTPPRGTQPPPASKPLFSFLSLRRSSAGKMPKMASGPTTAATSRPMEAAVTLPSSSKGKKTVVQSTRQTSSSGKVDLGRELRVDAGMGGRGEDGLRRTRSKAEERTSVQEWKQWAESIAVQEASLRAISQHRGSDASTSLSLSLSARSDGTTTSSLTRAAASAIPSSAALISEGIISNSHTPSGSPSLGAAPFPSATPARPLAPPIIPRRTSSFTHPPGPSAPRLSTSTATTSASIITHPLSITKSSTYSATDADPSTAPSSPVFAPSQTSLLGPPPLHTVGGGDPSQSPFLPLRSRFTSPLSPLHATSLPRTLLAELLATLSLFRTSYPHLILSSTPASTSSQAHATLTKEVAFYQTEILAVVGEISDLLGPEFGRILRLGCVGGYGPLSRDGASGTTEWGLGRGERWEEGTWWVDRLRRDLEVGLMWAAGGGAARAEELDDDADGWKDDVGEDDFGPPNGNGGQLERDGELREEGRRRYEAWKAGKGVQGVRLGGAGGS